jgi:hypothetical protein
MLVQDSRTGYFHEVPDHHVAGYGEYGGYGWYGEEPDPQAPPIPDPQTPPIAPPPQVPPNMANEDMVNNMYPEGYPYPQMQPWQSPYAWFRPWKAWWKRPHWGRYRQYRAWPGRWAGWARHRAGGPGRWTGWARRWARPLSPLMAARRVVARPGRVFVRDHRRR